MQSLPDEVLVHIFQQLGWEEVAKRACLVCQTWLRVGRDDALWHSFFIHSFCAQRTTELHAAVDGEASTSSSSSSWFSRFAKEQHQVQWWLSSSSKHDPKEQQYVCIPFTFPADLPQLTEPPNFLDSNWVKVLVMGDVGVGKTALVNQFIQNVFIESSDPDVDDSYEKRTQVDEVPLKFDVLDAGRKEYQKYMYDSWIRSADVVALVYSATSLKSFQSIRAFYHRLQLVKDCWWVPCVLVENKIDLVDAREVREGLGERAARATGCLFVKASAKTGHGVDDVFHSAARLLAATADGSDYAHHRQRPPQRARCYRRPRYCILS